MLFREPLLAVCGDLDELRDEIHVTLVHEIAHHLGWSDADIRAVDDWTL